MQAPGQRIEIRQASGHVQIIDVASITQQVANAQLQSQPTTTQTNKKNKGAKGKTDKSDKKKKGNAEASPVVQGPAPGSHVIVITNQGGSQAYQSQQFGVVGYGAQPGLVMYPFAPIFAQPQPYQSIPQVNTGYVQQVHQTHICRNAPWQQQPQQPIHPNYQHPQSYNAAVPPPAYSQYLATTSPHYPTLPPYGSPGNYQTPQIPALSQPLPVKSLESPSPPSLPATSPCGPQSMPNKQSGHPQDSQTNRLLPPPYSQHLSPAISNQTPVGSGSHSMPKPPVQPPALVACNTDQSTPTGPVSQAMTCGIVTSQNNQLETAKHVQRKHKQDPSPNANRSMVPIATPLAVTDRNQRAVTPEPSNGPPGGTLTLISSEHQTHEYPEVKSSDDSIYCELQETAQSFTYTDYELLRPEITEVGTVFEPHQNRPGTYLEINDYTETALQASDHNKPNQATPIPPKTDAGNTFEPLLNRPGTYLEINDYAETTPQASDHDKPNQATPIPPPQLPPRSSRQNCSPQQQQKLEIQESGHLAVSSMETPLYCQLQMTTSLSSGCSEYETLVPDVTTERQRPEISATSGTSPREN